MATATKSKTSDKFAAAQELKAAERELVQKYGPSLSSRKLRVVPGSLRAGAKHGFGSKRVVDIKCKCGAVRTVATSDVFHVKGCEECTKALRNAARSAAGSNGKPTKSKK